MKNTTTAPIKVKGSLRAKWITIALLLTVLLVLVGCGRVLNAPTFNNITAYRKEQ